MNIKLSIRHINYVKRRLPDPHKIFPVSVEIPELQLVDNNICSMHMTFDNSETHILDGRVQFNPQKGKWAIAGTHKGELVMVDVLT